MSEEELVVDEEFRAEDAEEDYARDDVGYVFVKSVGRRYLTCSLFKEHEQESDECHEERIELREPRNDYRGESVSAGCVCRDGSTPLTTMQKTRTAIHAVMCVRCTL